MYRPREKQIQKKNNTQNEDRKLQYFVFFFLFLNILLNRNN